MSLSWRRMYYSLGISYVYTINSFVVKSKDIKIVFIIGNGFDIDLGGRRSFHSSHRVRIGLLYLLLSHQCMKL